MSNLSYSKNRLLLVLLGIGLFGFIISFFLPYLLLISGGKEHYYNFLFSSEFYYLRIFSTYGVYIISAIVVYVDSKKISAGMAFEKEKFFKSVTWKPIGWAILVFFIWILIFPLYIINRKKVFEANKFAHKVKREEVRGESLQLKEFLLSTGKGRKILCVLVVLLLILTFILAYYIQNPNRLIFKVEMSSDKYGIHDWVEHTESIVNKNLYSIKFEYNVSEMVYIWKNGCEDKIMWSGSSGIRYLGTLWPFQERKLGSGGCTASALPISSLIPGYQNMTEEEILENAVGRYFVQGVLHCNSHDIWSEVVSFVLVKE